MVTSDSGDSHGPDWSRDDFLVYAKSGSGQNDLWTLNMAGDRKPEVFLQTAHNELSPSFSPDGRWIAYQSSESTRFEIYVRPFPFREGKFTISRNGGWSPRWRRDGKELFFLSPDGTMMAAGIDTTKGLTATVPQPLFTTGLMEGDAHPYAVTKDGRFLMKVHPRDLSITVVLNWPAIVVK